MDILAIEEAIEELEHSDTTVSNVSELASLYIVRDKLKDVNINVANALTDEEMMDIVLAYKRYCTVKTQYQRNEVQEELVLNAFNDVCIQVKEFLECLYSGTDFFKERKRLRQLIDDICVIKDRC